MKNQKISAIGEFAFIDIIKGQFLNKNTAKNVISDIGDDCFCFKMANEYICVTKDMLIEDVHFKKNWTSAKHLGKKAVEVNVSDIASMGDVKPEYIFIGLGIPKNTSVKYLKELYKAIKETSAKYKMIIAGGDTVKAEKLVISVTIIGKSKNRVIQRAGAKTGDLVGVTNTFGDAGAGVDLLYKYGKNHQYSKDERYLIRRQNCPVARLKEAKILSKYVTSMTDASDGLYVSAGLLAKHSKKGAQIDLNSIPISKQLQNIVKSREKQQKYVLFGAEDFELVFTVPKNKSKKVKALLPQVSYIGKVDNSKKVKYFKNDKEQKIKYSGYKHF